MFSLRKRRKFYYVILNKRNCVKINLMYVYKRLNQTVIFFTSNKKTE